ncbi:tRNA (adenosine(37)-N6)-threonylcarbamoyltransferase complex dimerization subunit type 1 TsaB [Peteryoungia ipomoeae]|uniref:tRNA (Adenosine(37)-N6)-threonylcarbamoyltransferase complex dimerization subunit type 1 TsaB n=1 Tax=Peteryoungia ipomoeae TaxID=1210932 RepID=A0A4S8P1M5_9HYPH|nr:tRNA (adenosine(37)-N6)-threonylcarbamoyltransferase complex dimerization subunit type 1 TsaB [Peteryoungia ipomoeae]THV23927.1 tRNA (adenosine(37)-N6)-threonylcarbamoyltransferase complex dimerization subunit type 1 TsaB [Peteryoungia ipomoeae]
MIVLAIDTAGVDCAVAIYDAASSRILSRISETIGRGHAERLMAMVDEALDAASLPLDAIQRIGVTVGPGSFTGIRVGVAAARGLALALGVDCVGVNTLEVLARTVVAAPGKTVLAGMNAHREEVYLQAFRDQIACEAPALATVDDYLTRAAKDAMLVGSAEQLVTDPTAQTAPDHFPIETVALIAAQATAQGKAKPLYLRGPDAKPQTGFAVARA